VPAVDIPSLCRTLYLALKPSNLAGFLCDLAEEADGGKDREQE
jgi:hypothetical protein